MGSERPTGRLPGELTEFVGQRAELARVRQALGATRLVTLTGPGGIGKTRLALRAASGARRAFRDGVWPAELSGLRAAILLAAFFGSGFTSRLTNGYSLGMTIATAVALACCAVGLFAATARRSEPS